MAIWDDVLTERDKVVFKKAGWGKVILAIGSLVKAVYQILAWQSECINLSP